MQVSRCTGVLVEIVVEFLRLSRGYLPDLIATADIMCFSSLIFCTAGVVEILLQIVAVQRSASGVLHSSIDAIR